MSEQQLLSLIMIFCRRLGVLLFHGYDGYHVSEPGFPDGLAAGECGQLIFELKVGNGTLNISQMRWRRMLQRGGARYFVWTEDDWHCGRIQRELEQLAFPLEEAA
jgi:hypothetical protein